MFNNKTLAFFILSFSIFINTVLKADGGGLKITEFQMSTSTNGFNSPDNSIENFRKLSFNSAIIQNDFSNNTSLLSSYTTGFNLLQLGVSLRNKNKEVSPLYRLVISSGKGRIINGTYSKSEVYRVDTFVNSSGQKYFRDSLVNDYYNFSQFVNIIQVEYAVIYQTKNPNKLKMFGGYGLNAGISLSARTEISHSRNNTTDLYYSPYYYTNRSNGIKEFYKNKTQSTIALIIPFGLDYRLSKKHSFWKQVHIFQESQFKLQYYHIPELGNSIQTILQIGIGLKVNLSAN